MTGRYNSQETRRLAALHRYDVLDTPPEEAFDRITRLAKTALRTDIALVSLIDADRQWFKSRQNLEASETKRDISFCTHAIESDDALVVRNALEDERFRENPLVTGEPHIRFYAGVPLKLSDGNNIGTLCVIDRQPRDLSDAEASMLYDLARLVVDELELRDIAMTDSLTGLQTRRAFDSEAVREIKRARRYDREASMIIFDLDRFKSVNDTYGHAFGDTILRKVSTICAAELRSVDMFGRLGGEEFGVFMPETAQAGAMEAAERLRKTIESTPIGNDALLINLTASFGVTELSDTDCVSKDLLMRADKALYQAKDAGRNRVVFAGPSCTISKVA